MPTVPPRPGLQNLTVDNSDPPDNQVVAAPLAFTNQQLWIALTDGNCDFSRFRGDGRDFQAYDTDGSTPLVTTLRSWRLGPVGLRFHSRFSVPAGPSPSMGPYVHAGSVDCADLGYPNPPHTVVAYQTQAGTTDGKQQGQLRCYDKNMTVLWTWTSPNNDSINDFAFADLDGDGVLDTVLAGTSRIDRSVYALSLANPPATKWVYPFSTQGNTYIRAVPTEGNLRHDLPGNEVIVSGSEGQDGNSNGPSHGKVACLSSSGAELWVAYQDPAVLNHTTQDAIIADLLNTGQTSVYAVQAQHVYKYSNVGGSPVWTFTHDGNRNYYGVSAGHLASKATKVIAAVAGVALNDAYIGVLTVLDDSGAVLWEKPLAAHGYNVKCVDLDGDGWDELIVTTGTAAGGPSQANFGPPVQGWGLVTIYDHLGNELFATTQPSPTKHFTVGNFDGTGRLQLQGAGDEGRVMRWNVDSGVKTATVKVIVPSVPWKSTRDLWFGSTGAATQPPRGDRYFDMSGADGSAPIGMVQQLGAWTNQGGMYASPDDADTATAACLEAADVVTEAFEWEWTAYKPGQGSGTAGPYYNAARYRCTNWSGGRPDGYLWQHGQNGQIFCQRTASGTGTATYTVTSSAVNVVTFNATDKMAYRCVVFGDWHALYVNKNDAGFRQIYNVQDTDAGRKSSAGSVAFLSQRGQTKIAASTIWTFRNQDGNSGTGPVPFLYSLDSNAAATPAATAGRRLLESGAARLLESGAARLLEGASVAVAAGHRLLESGAARLLESGAFRLLEGDSAAVVAGHRLLESGAARLLESGAFRLLETPKPVDLTAYNAYWTFSPTSGIIGDGPNTRAAWKPQGGAIPSPANYAVCRGTGTISQSFTVVTPGVYTVAVQSQVSYWGPAGYVVKVDGVQAGAAEPATGQFAWLSRTFTTATALSAGPHVLSFEGRPASTDPAVYPNQQFFLDSVSITGPGAVTLLNPGFDSYAISDAVVMNPPAVAVATYRLVASVATSGKSLYCRLTRISDGATVQPGVINEAPTLTVNGVGRGHLRVADASMPVAATPAHPTMMIPLPAGVAVAAGDVVAVSASEGWLLGPNGYAEAMVGQPASVRVGVPFARDTGGARTAWVGAAIAHYGTAQWHSGFQGANQIKRCAYWTPEVVSADAGGRPTELSGPTTSAPIVNVTWPNNLDATGYPTPEGLWGLAWDDLDGLTAYSLWTLQDPNGSVTPVGSVDVPIPGGGGTRRFRVYDCRRTGSVTNFQLWLKLSYAGPSPYRPHSANECVLAPGDFTWTPGQSTIPPTPAWSDLSAIFKSKVPTSLPCGPFRIATAGISLGESAACEREHCVVPVDFHWMQDSKSRADIRYIQARPWTAASSPYVYDPLTGTDYPATLATPIVTAPAPGTVETITLAQVDDGLILAGLVLTIDGERMRVMADPTGTPLALATRVMRGVESTTPAFHGFVPPAVKAISVSARRPVASLAAWGDVNKQVTELVTQSPHGLKTDQIVKMEGDGWVPFTYTDGRGFGTTTPGDGDYHGFAPYPMPVYVTGASTFVVIATGPVAGSPNVTLSAPYALNPGPATYDCWSLLYLPEYGGMPYEWAASTAAQYPGVPAWVTFCMAASDDMVDVIWRDKILPYIPADRDVYFELGDEPWNSNGTPYQCWHSTSFMLYGTPDPLLWYSVRVQRIRARGRAIWAAAGRDPMRIKSTINVQTTEGIAAGLSSLLAFMAARGGTPDVVTIAPYYNFYMHAALYKCFAAWDADMIPDLLQWDGCDCTAAGAGNFWGSHRSRLGAFRAALDAWNKTHTPAVGLGIYEYAPEKPWPEFIGSLGAAMDATTTTLVLGAGEAATATDNAPDDAAKVQPGTWLLVGSEWVTVASRSGPACVVARAQGGTTAAAHAAGTGVRNDWIEGIRDATLHPGYGPTHRSILDLFQSFDLEVIMPSSLDQEWTGATAWSDHHGIGQVPGVGDGSDGLADNRLCLARRGQPHSKAATVNQDANTVSVRGRAILDFLSGVSTSGYALEGPATAVVGVASGPFTASLVGPMGSPATITPHVAGIAGTLSPASVVIPAGSISGAFTFTPAGPGTAAISTTNDSSLADPPALTLVASYTVPPATSYALDGPTAATVGRPSSPFVVTLAGGALGSPATFTPHVAGLAGTFTPATAVIPAGSSTASFTFTPAATGTATISVTNGSGLADPAARPLACANPLPPETFQAAPVVVFRPAAGPGFAKTFVPRRPPVRRVVRRGR